MLARVALLSVIVSLPARTLPAQGAALDRAPSRFATYQGARIHYKSLGLGTTAVVFIHGWNCDLSSWKAQVGVVDGRTRALFIDLPGFGRSDKPQVDYTMDYFAAAINAVLQAAQVERAVLVGHSMGTPVVRQFYRRYRPQTLALVAVDGAWRSFFPDTVAARPFLAQIEGADYAANIERMFGGMAGDKLDPGTKAALLRVATSTPQRVAMSAMRAMINPAIWGDDPVEVPVLSVMAPNPGWSAEYQAYVRRLIPDVKQETIAGAGHFVMIDHSAEFNALLLEFLRGLKVVR